MRTTITLDDALVATAKDVTGNQETSTPLREALTAQVQREAARRIMLIGGTEPDLRPAPRRRMPPE